MLGRQLDFDPGARFAYCNFGYSLLGRVIEKQTGMSYDQATQQLVLRPAGITAMQLGRTRVQDRAEGEVRYYHHAGAERVASVFLYEKEKVAWPDGGFYVEAFDAHGGWIASAVDLARFVTAIDGGIGGGDAGDWFEYTVFFDEELAPLNYAIFGPEFTFTGQMISGEVTIVDPNA